LKDVKGSERDILVTLNVDGWR